MDQEELTRLNEEIEQQSRFVDTILQEVGKVIVGQRYLLDRLLIGLLARGHILLEGLPGLAKTLSIKTLSHVIKTNFQRIQFTPDLLPADLIGTQVYNPRDQIFTMKKGPLFTNLILADEINRAPAKVQSALLEAMQERQVTIGTDTFFLEEPFLVMATQNPIEQEGTYSLPEAQIDRFIMKLRITYPDREEEREIIRRMAGHVPVEVEPVVTPEEILGAREVVNRIYVDPKITEYIIDLVIATRKPEEYGLGDLQGMILYGASPRASIYLTEAARTHAFLHHRGYVTPEDVKALAPDILRHRIILSYEAEAEELTTDDVVQKILERIEVP